MKDDGFQRAALLTFTAFVWVCFLAMLLILSGCAALGGGDGMVLDIDTPEKSIHFKTDYQIENGLRLVRTDGGEYDIELGSASTKDAEMGVVVELLRMMQQMMMMGVTVQPAAPPQE